MNLPQDDLRAAFTHAIEASGHKVKSINVVALTDEMGPRALRADFDLPDTTGHNWHIMFEFVHMPMPVSWSAWPVTDDQWHPVLSAIRVMPLGLGPE